MTDSLDQLKVAWLEEFLRFSDEELPVQSSAVT